jgi:SAM-dependent methyltransferase
MTPALSSVGAELLDDPDADPRIVAQSLHHIARSNFWFGGTLAVRYGLARLLAGHPAGATLTLLDIGTGVGDLPLSAARWARRRGWRLVPVGLERSRVAAGLARERGVATAVACASAPPFGPKSVDLVLVSQVAHHLAPAAVVELCRRSDALARVGVVIADLRRSRLAAGAFRVGSGLLGFDAVTRVDGLTSIRRGYSVAELLALTAEAGVRAEVRRRPGFRIVASWHTAGGVPAGGSWSAG